MECSAIRIEQIDGMSHHHHPGTPTPKPQIAFGFVPAIRHLPAPHHLTHPPYPLIQQVKLTNGDTQRRGSCGSTRSACFFPPLLLLLLGLGRLLPFLRPPPASRAARARAAPPQLWRRRGAERGNSAYARAQRSLSKAASGDASAGGGAKKDALGLWGLRTSAGRQRGRY